MMPWLHSGTGLVTAFLAALVEFVEALTIVLAVGTVRGWRPALLGAAGGTIVLAGLVAALGPLLARAPLEWLQLAIGVLLLLFGMRWLRKAVLRAAGIVALHDEAHIFDEETQEMRRVGATHEPFDAIAIVTSFKAVLLEGLEVVFIVVAIGGATGGLVAPVIGGGAALLLVVLLGIVIHRPLARVPENALKFAVGVLLSAFGTFWIGEGLGFVWPGHDLAIPVLIAGFAASAFVAVAGSRRTSTHPAQR
jgi:uncharacterized membrane protein